MGLAGNIYVWHNAILCAHTRRLESITALTINSCRLRRPGCVYIWEKSARRCRHQPECSSRVWSLGQAVSAAAQIPLSNHTLDVFSCMLTSYIDVLYTYLVGFIAIDQ